MKLFSAALVIALLSCSGPSEAPASTTFHADILTLIDSSAPPGMWVEVIPDGDSLQAVVATFGNSSCVRFTSNGSPFGFLINFGDNLGKSGTTAVWVPARDHPHFTIVADSVELTWTALRTSSC